MCRKYRPLQIRVRLGRALTVTLKTVGTKGPWGDFSLGGRRRCLAGPNLKAPLVHHGENEQSEQGKVEFERAVRRLCWP
jgi:hypothetical protein